jgi:hypothetical protein
MNKMITALETFSNTSNADTNIQNGVLAIDNNAANTPTPSPIVRSEIASIVTQKSLVETPSVINISWTLASLTTYQFQLIEPNGYTGYNFYFVSDASATNLEVGNAIANFVNATGVATATYSTGSSIDLTAVAGKPLFTVQVLSPSLLSAASNMPKIDANTTPATALSGTTTVTVKALASPAQSFKTGEVVTITNATGFTFTDAFGNSSVGSVTARIVYVDGTTFTLDGITGSGTNTSTPTITKVAQNSFGTAAQVTSEVNRAGYTANALSNYDRIRITTKSGNVFDFWLRASDVASPFNATTNLSVFYSDMNVFQSTAFTSSVWGAPTGTASRLAFATGSVTVSELAQRVKALIDDITALQQKSNSLPIS